MIDFPDDNHVNVYHFYKNQYNEYKSELYSRYLTKSDHFAVNIIRNRSDNSVTLYQGKKN